MSDERRISLEGVFDDDLADIRRLVGRLAILNDSSESRRVLVDLQRVEQIGLAAITLMAGSLLAARRRGTPVEVIGPSNPQLINRLQLAGFDRLINDVTSAQSTPTEGDMVPLQVFGPSLHVGADPILKTLERFEHVSEDLRFALEIAVNECVDNIDDHSQSPIGGIGCARYIAETRAVRIAMVDWGRGIGRTLRGGYADIFNDEQALRRVMFGGYTAKSRPHNLGRGLDNLRGIVADAFGGDLVIFSGSASVGFKGRETPRYNTELAPFQGTIVCFTLPMRLLESIEGSDA